MSSVLSNCPPPNDPCARLLQEIMDFINRDKRALGGGGTHGLKHRFPEQINGANGPGTVSWNNHEQQIKDQQRGLEKRLRDFERNGCGPPPPGAWEWATRPVPKPAEWRGPAVPRISNEAFQDGAKAVAVVGGGLAVGYIAYRVIRFLPSLAPPLWWTIPANAAIP
jgi:hypothetical protein